MKTSSMMVLLLLLAQFACPVDASVQKPDTLMSGILDVPTNGTTNVPFEERKRVPPECLAVNNDRFLVIVEPLGVPLTHIESGTGGINEKFDWKKPGGTWVTIWDNTKAVTTGAKVDLGTLAAGKHELRLRLGGSYPYQFCSRRSETYDGKPHILFFRVANAPGLLGVGIEDWLWDATSPDNPDFNDLVVVFQVGEANVNATIAAQGVDATLDPASRLGVVARELVPLSVGPVEPVMLAYEAPLDVAVPVVGTPVESGAEELPPNSQYVVTAIKSEDGAVVPSGSYKSKVRVKNRFQVAEAEARIRVNFPPVAVADDLDCFEGTVTLDGSRSYDADSDQALGHEWAQVDGPVVALSGDGPTRTANLKKGTYKFRLTVRDGLNSACKDVVVNVAASPKVPIIQAKMVEIRGLVDRNGSKVSMTMTLNGKPHRVQASQNNWWTRFDVAYGSTYDVLLTAKNKEGSSTQALRVIVGEKGEATISPVLEGYGQDGVGGQDGNQGKGKGVKPPAAPADF